jgi:hypothetical protein
MSAQIAKITQVLNLYSQGINPGAIPKVHVRFTCEPSDIGTDEWTIHVILEAYEDFSKCDGNGTPLATFSKEWEDKGASPSECSNLMALRLSQFLSTALVDKKTEVTAIESALAQLTGDDNLEDIQPIWGAETKEQAFTLEAADEQNDAGDIWTPGSDDPRPLVTLK